MAALIAYRNLADQASLSGAALPGFPPTNLQTRQLDTVWRAHTAGATQITVDLGSAQTVSMVALLAINSGARSASDLTVEYSSNGSTWSTAVASVPSDAGAPDLPRGLIARVRAQGSNPLSKLTTRYLRITASWATIGNANYREAGRLWVGNSIDVPEGCDAGWSLSNHDYGTLDRSAGQQVYADRRTRVRVLNVSMTGIDTSIAYGFAESATVAANVPSLDDLINYAGSTGEVIVAPRADAPLWLRRTGIYGHLTPDSLRIRHLSGPNYACDLTIEEER